MAAQQILRLERGAVSSSQDSHLDLLKQAGIWLYGPGWIAPMGRDIGEPQRVLKTALQTGEVPHSVARQLKFRLEARRTHLKEMTRHFPHTTGYAFDPNDYDRKWS